MANATRYAAMDPVQYNIDGGLGGSGVLDIARELQLRTKHWAYAWRMTNDSFWVNRTWTELQVGAFSCSFGQPFPFIRKYLTHAYGLPRVLRASCFPALNSLWQFF